MIISTIPLDDVNIPYVEVRSPMLEKDDILDIQRKVLEIRRETAEKVKNGSRKSQVLLMSIFRVRSMIC